MVQVLRAQTYFFTGACKKTDFALGRENNTDTEDEAGREKDWDFCHLPPKGCQLHSTRLWVQESGHKESQPAA